MADKRVETRQSSGYLRVADVADIIGKTREWTYELLDSGKLESEMRYVVGRGIRPVRLVKYESALTFINESLTGEEARLARKKAYNKSRDIKLSSLTPEVIPDLARRYEAGEDLQVLAEEHDTSARTISMVLREYGTLTRTSGDRYARERQAFLESLPEGERRKIKRLYEAGHGLVSIAKELGWGDTAHSKVRRALQAMNVPLRDRKKAASAKWSSRREEMRAA